jgi:hypothetical protein
MVVKLDSNVIPDYSVIVNEVVPLFRLQPMLAVAVPGFVLLLIFHSQAMRPPASAVRSPWSAFTDDWVPLGNVRVSLQTSPANVLSVMDWVFPRWMGLVTPIMEIPAGAGAEVCVDAAVGVAGFTDGVVGDVVSAGKGEGTGDPAPDDAVGVGIAEGITGMTGKDLTVARAGTGFRITVGEGDAKVLTMAAAGAGDEPV